MAKENKIGLNLTEGNILKMLLVFILPIFMTNLVQQFYNIVDVVIVGQYVGKTGTVGVSTGGEIVNLLTFVSIGFSSGVQVYISQLYGQKDYDRIRETIGTALTLMFLMSAACTVLSLALCRQSLKILNTPKEAMGQSYDYMMITALGLPSIFGYNAVCGILRGMGEARRPFLFVLISAVANIFLDLLFVAVWDMQAAGTAWATVIAQLAAFIASLVFMYRKREHFQFDFKPESFRMKQDHVKILMELGVPLAASTTFIHLSQIYCNAHINAYGIIDSTVNGIGNKVVRFANLITSSINTGASTMIGQNLGAGKYDRAKRTVYISMGLAVVMGLLNCMLCVLAPQAVLRLFTSDLEVIEAGITFMHISVITFLLAAWQGPYQAMVTGAGHAKLNFLVGILDGVILRIGISVVLAEWLGLGVSGYYYGNALARLAPCVICTVYFYSGRWRTRKLLTGKDGREAEMAEA